MAASIQEMTGSLFGPLWQDLTDSQYRESVELFTKRALANDFDLNWLKGKYCLDAGCGSGRYSVALATHGAKQVEAIDVSESGLAEAGKRAADFTQIHFRKASVLDIPFEDGTFDLVWCAGVIHHTPDFDRGISEVSRVVKAGGKLFLLLYGAGGLRWKLIKSLRPLIRDLGHSYMESAIRATGLPANNRKHFMDDLLVPIQKLTRFDELREVLNLNGFDNITRWTGETFDHESDVASQIEDMDKIDSIVRACADSAKSEEQIALCSIMKDVVKSYIDVARNIENDASLSEETKKQIIIGEGLLRVVADKNR